MAQLKDTLVQGNLRVTDTTYTYELQIGASQSKNSFLGAPSSANGAPSFRVLVNDDLPIVNIAHGGTGVNSHTANRLVWSNASGNLQATDNHYADATKIAINSETAPTENFYVNGTSLFNGDMTIKKSASLLSIIGTGASTSIIELKRENQNSTISSWRFKNESGILTLQNNWTSGTYFDVMKFNNTSGNVEISKGTFSILCSTAASTAKGTAQLQIATNEADGHTVAIELRRGLLSSTTSGKASWQISNEAYLYLRSDYTGETQTETYDNTVLHFNHQTGDMKVYSSTAASLTNATTRSGALEVVGGIAVGGAIKVGNLTIAGTYGTNAGKTITSSSTLTVEANSTTYINTGSNSSLIFLQNGTCKWRQAADGASLYPETAGGMDIGTASKYWGKIGATSLQLHRYNGTSYGRISWYKDADNQYTWFTYMSNTGNGLAPTGGAPGSLGNVTSWAMRSLIENATNYGWIWEACANSAASANNVTPTVRMALSSNTGQLFIAPNAATNGQTSSGLVVTTAPNGNGGAAAIELYRGTDKSSWQIANITGKLYLRNNWTSSTSTAGNYTKEAMVMEGDDGAVTFSGTITSTNQSGYFLKPNGAANYARMYVYTLGTASDGTTQGAQGLTVLELGNDTAREAATSTTGANNARGMIRLYGTGTTYTDIYSNPNGNRTVFFPAYGGNMYLAHVASSTSAYGSNAEGAAQPVYAAARGRIAAITNAISTAYGGTGNTSFTASTLIYASTATKLSSLSTVTYSNASSSAKINVSVAGEAGFTANNTNKTHQTDFIVGSSGNGGIYDRTNSKWIVATNESGSTTYDGGAFNSTIKLVGEKYMSSATPAYGLDANNSDIVNVNGIFTKDLANDFFEGLLFYRSVANDVTHWDAMSASNGTFYFGSDITNNAKAFKGDAAIQCGAITSSQLLTNTFGDSLYSRHLQDLAFYDYRGSTAQTGTIKIKLPHTISNNVMHVFRIIVYDYTAAIGGAELLVSGYTYNSKAWINYNASVVGTFTKGIRLAHDGTNYCILLGTTTSTWSYGKIVLADIYSGFNAIPTSGYEISLITSETGYTITGEGDIGTHLRADHVYAGKLSTQQTDVQDGRVIACRTTGESQLMASNGTHKIYLYCNSDGRSGIYGVTTGNTSHAIIATPANSTTSTFYGDLTGTAAKATADANGNDIGTSYFKEYVQTIDLTASTYNANTWYPVSAVVPYAGLQRVACQVQLNSGSKPSWSSHSSGFTAVVELLIVAGGWGTTGGKVLLLLNDQRWVASGQSNPVGFTHFTNSSRACFYLRGGAKYKLMTSWFSTWDIYATSTTVSSQTLAPTTTAPNITSGDWDINISGNAATASTASICSGNAATATRINGALGAISSNTSCNLWVSSDSSASGVPKYVANFYINASTGELKVPGKVVATTFTTAASTSTYNSSLTLSNMDFNRASVSSGGTDADYSSMLGEMVSHLAANSGVILGTIRPNSQGPFLGNIYDYTIRNGSNLPQYSSFITTTLAGQIESFGTSSYVFYRYKYWRQGQAITGAVWNDYAEYRTSNCIEPGYVVMEKGDDTLVKTTERLQHFAGVTSDTWGFAQGETEEAKTPIAVAGRVLVYTYKDRNSYKPGDVVCAAPNGTVDIMTREEVINFPDRIVGTVSCVPDYEEWGGGKYADRDPVKINNRIWIKVK